MAKVAGKNVIFKIGAVTPSAVGVVDPAIDQSLDELDVTDTASSGNREYLAGFANASMSWSKWYDTTETPVEVGASLVFELDLGAKAFTGSCIVTGRKIGAALADSVKFDYTARITGALVYGNAT